MRRHRDSAEGDAIGERIRALRAPHEPEALERAVVLAATESERRGGASHSSKRRAAGGLAAGAAALVAAIVLTPAGASVRDWIGDAVDGASAPARTTLGHLPSGGSLLVQSESGPWVVRADGSRRLLGDYEAATWSPRGLFVGVSRGNQLSAVDPEGEVQWSISRPGRISDPRWAPSGYRVAFREGGGLGVVVGDGTAPRTLIGTVAPVAPSWRPPPEDTDARYAPNVLTYVQSRSIATVDVDTGRELWRQSTARRARSVEWAGPNRLVMSTINGIRVFDRSGRPLGSPPLPPATTIDSVAASPDGERIAIVLRDVAEMPDSRSRLYLARIAGGERRQRTVFSGFGSFGTPTFSPDGEWLLLPWEDTDQWLFIAPSTDRKLLRRVSAVGEIARQFDPGGRGRPLAPEVVGWCCA